MRFGIDSALVLVCCCGLLCTHLRDPVPRFRRHPFSHPFSDYGLASVCVCVCVCVCVYSAVVVRRSGFPAAGVGLREKCNLVPSFSRALSFFRFSQASSSFVARNIVCN